MEDQHVRDEKAVTFFDGIWKQGDYWQLESSPFEHAKYARQAELLADRRYARVLEIGCGAGVFTQQLAPLADRVLALDVSPAAIDRAVAVAKAAELSRVQQQGGTIEFRVANVMRFDPQAEGPWDLIVLSETIYYLGWLNSFFDVCWLAHRLFESTAHGGQLLMTNTCGGSTGYLLLPWIIRTYRDLMLNVQYDLEHEECFQGNKEGVSLEVLISLFRKEQIAEVQE
ncbi:MAG TPA: SAM-dependent methyltransferase [Pirellulaceae bacterium]|nr:SAM-dependent methyltransferase [Pirellulaceae bacterium]